MNVLVGAGEKRAWCMQPSLVKSIRTDRPAISDFRFKQATG